MSLGEKNKGATFCERVVFATEKSMTLQRTKNEAALAGEGWGAQHFRV